MLVSLMIDLSFDDEGDVSSHVSPLSDRSLPLVKVVFHVQVPKDEMMVQPAHLILLLFVIQLLLLSLLVLDQNLTK